MWGLGIICIMMMGVKMTTLFMITGIVLAPRVQASTLNLQAFIVEAMTLKTILLLPCVAHALLIKMKYIILVPQLKTLMM
jgi:hypothetical protein